MDSQDNNFNYKIITAALAAVIIGILIAFYYSNAQSNNKINFIEGEKKILVNKLTLMRANIDNLASENQVNDIDLKVANDRINNLLDSIGQLNFDIDKYTESKRQLRMWEVKYDSLNLKYNSLNYNNIVLSRSIIEAKEKAEEYKNNANTLADREEALRLANKKLNNELKNKTYLKLDKTDALGIRIRNGKVIYTNKASIITKLNGCTTVKGNPNESNAAKTLYFQFLDPNKRVIAHNANIIQLNGNEYSKRLDLIYTGINKEVCDEINVPAGSLHPGFYTLNVFEDEKLLSSKEFELK
ncbi:hypothetical protein MWU65_09665 [Cellulophaga sp. F20128]|uniref:hypothetical protein n=1 Tax=Cellulophaga sp. F20128 TaxID=2926413 RepID=UPI001FF662ED|nr:hypothetical protein [Cellulophaga sp. F20128]MCK0157444.1 hypothetical protein [Cellulophaga sp. F20128]